MSGLRIAGFLAQATNTELSAMQMVTILMVAMLTSKGASGVTGAGFVTLAATLSVVPAIPMVALATIVGIDRFMSECRAITNIIGNGVAIAQTSPCRRSDESGKRRLASEIGHPMTSKSVTRKQAPPVGRGS